MPPAGRGGAGPTTDKDQRLAHKRVSTYVGRLGLRKAAQRLGTTTSELRVWLEKKRFPKTKLADALTFNILGGATIPIQRTRLDQFVEHVGIAKASKLTGLSSKKIKEVLKHDPRRRIKIKRVALEELTKRGLEKAAKELGTTPGRLRAAKKPPYTFATARLKDVVKAYGPDQVASYLGITTSTLDRWLKNNIPRAWEGTVNQRIGLRRENFPGPKEIKRRKPTQRSIDAALKRIAEWNEKAPRGFRIQKDAAERWIRVGTFEENFEKIKKLSTEKPPKVPAKLPPAPPLPPPIPTLSTPRQPPKPRPPSKTVRPAKDSLQDAKLRDFLELRAEYFALGKGNVDRARKRYKDAPWNKAVRVDFPRMRGYVLYTPVEKFVHLIDIDKLAKEMIAKATRTWNMLDPHVGIMRITITLSAQGQGNPFYEDAWTPDKDSLDFFKSPYTVITQRDQIEHEVYRHLGDIYEMSEKITLFMENYEISRTEPK